MSGDYDPQVLYEPKQSASAQLASVTPMDGVIEKARLIVQATHEVERAKEQLKFAEGAVNTARSNLFAAIDGLNIKRNDLQGLLYLWKSSGKQAP